MFQWLLLSGLIMCPLFKGILALHSDVIRLSASIVCVCMHFFISLSCSALRGPALQVHCGVTADKQHQLADWRRRPLTDEMKLYAQTDTRYLLYIYDCLRRELWVRGGSTGGSGVSSSGGSTGSCSGSSGLSATGGSAQAQAQALADTGGGGGGKELLEFVFDSTRQLCLQRYEKQPFDPLGYQQLLQRSQQRKQLHGRSTGTGAVEQWTAAQEAALAALWDWRDRTARTEDEGLTFVMGDAELLRVARALPADPARLEQQCAPLSECTRAHADEVLAIVAQVLGSEAAGSRPEAKSGGRSGEGGASSLCMFTPAVPALAPYSASGRPGIPSSGSQLPLPPSPSPRSTPSISAGRVQFQQQQHIAEQQQQDSPVLSAFDVSLICISSFLPYHSPCPDYTWLLQP